MGSKAFESPLISHVRMRAMYRALVEVRALAEMHKDRSLRGVEACWVGTSIDLNEGDLTSDGGAGGAAWLAHIRAAGERTTAQALSAAELRQTMGARKSGPRKEFPGDAAERLTCACGAAMALEAAGAQAVMVAYVGRAELSDSAWKRALRLMEQPGLPLLVVVLPPRHDKGDLEGLRRSPRCR